MFWVLNIIPYCLPALFDQQNWKQRALIKISQPGSHTLIH